MLFAPVGGTGIEFLTARKPGLLENAILLILDEKVLEWIFWVVKRFRITVVTPFVTFLDWQKELFWIYAHIKKVPFVSPDRGLLFGDLPQSVSFVIEKSTNLLPSEYSLEPDPLATNYPNIYLLECLFSSKMSLELSMISWKLSYRCPKLKQTKRNLERLPNQSNLTYVLNGKKNVFPWDLFSHKESCCC